MEQKQMLQTDRLTDRPMKDILRIPSHFVVGDSKGKLGVGKGYKF